MTTIRVTTGSKPINVTVGSTTLNITSGATVKTASYISAGDKFYLDGATGNSYLTYNSSNNRVELYVDGTLKAGWGA